MNSVQANVIFCDDIRQEITGKFILIGFYPNDLVPAVIPTTLAMSACMRVTGVLKGQHTFKFRVISPSGKQMFEQADGIYIPDDDTQMILVFSGFPMEITTTGEIVAMIDVDGQALTPCSIRVVSPSRSSAIPMS